MHTHGGITIEHLKWLAVHSDVAPGDIFYWPSSTAWMTWNIGVSALLCGARIALFDGDPTQPDLAAYWKLAGEQGATHVGVSPPLLNAARRAGIVPSAVSYLSRVLVISWEDRRYLWIFTAGFTTRSDLRDVGLCQWGDGLLHRICRRLSPATSVRRGNHMPIPGNEGGGFQRRGGLGRRRAG